MVWREWVGARPGLRSYLLLSGVLAVLMAVQTLNRQWSTDVWDHAAVIRAFMVDPLSPAHPHVAVDAPHPFMTPYSWLLGVLAQFVSVLPALQVGAMVNLVLLLVGLWVFCRRVSTHPLTPTLALALTLLFWGPRAWRYSGFLHLNALGFTLPYPSIFAMALALIALAQFIGYLDGRDGRRLAGVLALGTVVLLTHPVAAVFLFGGMFAFAVSARAARGIVAAASVPVAALALGSLWPFYPLLELPGAIPQALHQSNQSMYHLAALRTAPILIAAGLVVWSRALRRLLDPVLLLVAGLGLVYAYGAQSEAWSWGRAIAPAVLVVHVAIADWIAGSTLRHDRRFHIAAAVAGVLGALNLAPGLARMVPLALLPENLATAPQLQPIDGPYRFLEDTLSDGDVVIARPDLGLVASAYGAKTIAPPLPHPFVPDTAARLADLAGFWEAPTHEQTRLIDRYDVSWILTYDEAADALSILAVDGPA